MTPAELRAALTIRSSGKLAKFAVFDLDNTLIAGDVTTAWNNFIYEAGITDDPVYRRVNDEMVRDYHAGTLDIVRYYERAMPAIMGLSREELDDFLDRFVDQYVAPIVYPQTLKLAEAAKTFGIPTCILSASGAFLVRAVEKYIPMDMALGVEFVEKDGVPTNVVLGTPTFQEGKVERTLEETKRLGIDLKDVIFYTDSRNDLPLAFATGDCCCVNPDPVLREAAEKNGWRLFTWTHKLQL